MALWIRSAMKGSLYVRKSGTVPNSMDADTHIQIAAFRQYRACFAVVIYLRFLGAFPSFYRRVR